MERGSLDEADYRFLTAPGANLQVSLATDERGEPELRFFGNRAGLLSFANVLLWFVANAWRREFLALAELPFVRVAVPLGLTLRLTNADATGQDGFVCRTDRGEQFEWTVAEDDLKRVALLVHRLVSKPDHEYDRLDLAAGSAAEIHVRLTEV